MSLKCCCSRPVCSARVFSFLCVCSRLLWVSAGPPTDVRGRPTGGAPHSQTPTLPGMGFFRPTHCCSGPTNGRRATLPNTNPSWDGFFPAHPLMLGADQREARHTPEHQPFLGCFLPAYPLMLGADQREAVVGAGHRGMLRHLANSSSLAFCMRSAASVSLRSLDCRASRSAVIPGFKYCFHFFNDTSFS